MCHPVVAGLTLPGTGRPTCREPARRRRETHLRPVLRPSTPRRRSSGAQVPALGGGVATAGRRRTRQGSLRCATSRTVMGGTTTARGRSRAWGPPRSSVAARPGCGAVREAVGTQLGLHRSMGGPGPSPGAGPGRPTDRAAPRRRWTWTPPSAGCRRPFARRPLRPCGSPGHDVAPATTPSPAVWADGPGDTSHLYGRRRCRRLTASGSAEELGSPGHGDPPSTSSRWERGPGGDTCPGARPRANPGPGERRVRQGAPPSEQCDAGTRVRWDAGLVTRSASSRQHDQRTTLDPAPTRSLAGRSESGSRGTPAPDQDRVAVAARRVGGSEKVVLLPARSLSGSRRPRHQAEGHLLARVFHVKHGEGLGYAPRPHVSATQDAVTPMSECVATTCFT